MWWLVKSPQPHITQGLSNNTAKREKKRSVWKPPTAKAVKPRRAWNRIYSQQDCFCYICVRQRTNTNSAPLKRTLLTGYLISAGSFQLSHHSFMFGIFIRPLSQYWSVKSERLHFHIRTPSPAATPMAWFPVGHISRPSISSKGYFCRFSDVVSVETDWFLVVFDGT